MTDVLRGFVPATLMIFFSRHYWVNQFDFKKFLQSFFAVCGVAATGIEALKKVFDIFKSPDQTNWMASFIIENHWSVIGSTTLFGVLISLYLLKPLTKVSARLRQRDLNISIEVGDFFATKQTLVVGANTTFDTSLDDGLIMEASLQGQFTKRYYGKATNHLDSDLEAALQGVAFIKVKQNEKPIGKRNLYPMGTVAKINFDGRSAYLVAMANMNGHGVASTSLEEVRTALSSLWLHISEKGGGLPSLRVPILGSGFGKLVETRQEVIREILKSFVAACVSDRFCDEFTLIISVKDYVQHQIDINELADFLKYLATYTEMRNSNEIGKGTGLSG